jgi:hypothetical protein
MDVCEQPQKRISFKIKLFAQSGFMNTDSGQEITESIIYLPLAH